MERPGADLLAAAVEEITALLRLHYPEVRVETVPGDRPGSLQLVVIADVEDPEEVLAVVNERLRAWAARGVHLSVVPVRPPERILEYYRARRARRPPVKRQRRPPG